MMSPRLPPSGLVVLFQSRQVTLLCPGDPPFTFGRGYDRTLRFGHDVVAGRPDLHISSNAGSIRWAEGRWVVCNDSKTRPFDVIVRGVANPLPPRSSPDSRSEWAVSPPGLEIRVVAPSGQYLLSIEFDAPRSLIAETTGDEGQTMPLREVSDHDRLLLAAKFLTESTPGDAVGNRKAALHATAARPHDRPVTERAVDNCVGRWREKLEELGVTGIGGRDNINQLGRQLLAWGFLRQEDHKLLRRGR